MRTIFLVILAAAALTSCNSDATQRTDAAAHRAGENAERAAQDLKRETKIAADKVRDASKEFKKGVDDAKHEDPQDHKDHPDDPNR
jgi:hypothetical protein